MIEKSIPSLCGRCQPKDVLTNMKEALNYLIHAQIQSNLRMPLSIFPIRTPGIHILANKI